VFKVIALGVNRKPVYNFFLVINSNLGPILYHFWDTGYSDLLPKNRKFFLTLSHSAPLLRWTLSNLWKSFMDPETRVFQVVTVKIWWS